MMLCRRRLVQVTTFRGSLHVSSSVRTVLLLNLSTSTGQVVLPPALPHRGRAALPCARKSEHSQPGPCAP